MQGDLVTVVGRHHLTVNEAVRGKQVLIKVGSDADHCIITVPERFVNFPTTPPPGPAVTASQPGKLIGRDRTERQSYYGPVDREQPWDTMRRKGWGASFAGSNVLKYLRRQKNADDLEKARWYWVELHKMADQDQHAQERVWGTMVLTQLLQELTSAEVTRLVPLTEFPDGALDPTLVRGDGE